MDIEYLFIGIISAIGLVALLSMLLKRSIGVCHSKRDLKGKTVLITGCDTGVGFETAKDIAKRNARVILACKTISLASRTLDKLQVSTGNGNLVAKQVDLSSFASVRAFASDILASERRLDVLINNAAVLTSRRIEKTGEGLETTMATNHFGHFLLTNLLLPLLRKSAPSRVVVVTSIGHEWTRLDFDNLNGEKSFNNAKAHLMTKLANVYFANELAKKLEGTGVTVNSLHTGLAQTDLFRNLHIIQRFLIRIWVRLFFKNAVEGAQTSIYVSVAEELEGVTGKYFVDCAEKGLKPHARDAAAARRLWLLSEKITEVSFDKE